MSLTNIDVLEYISQFMYNKIPLYQVMGKKISKQNFLDFILDIENYPFYHKKDLKWIRKYLQTPPKWLFNTHFISNTIIGSDGNCNKFEVDAGTSAFIVFNDYIASGFHAKNNILEFTLNQNIVSDIQVIIKNITRSTLERCMLHLVQFVKN